MNPYTILGVSASATDQEIKRAYRNLVKRYHPDRRSSESSHEQIVLINQAYDILSNPEKRAQYDRGYASVFYAPVAQENPMEAYKRDYKRKRREREKERDEELARKKAIYRVLRGINVVVLVFGAWLVLQDWFSDGTWRFWHVIMTGSAAYICYQSELNDNAYKLAQWNLFIFAITVLAMFE